MKNIKKQIMITLITALVLSACSLPFRITSTPSPPDSHVSDTEGWQEQVDALKALRRMPIPEHFLYLDVPVDEDIFNPNELLDILDHLQLKPGYLLDFVYYEDGSQGFPILYARQEGAPSFQTIEDYSEAFEQCDQPGSVILCSHMDAILTDGTDAGYFQWVLMHLMGDQFYLFWHALYHDHEIIASQEKLTDLVESLAEKQNGDPLSPELKDQALEINPAPVVTIEDDKVSVRVIVFTKWGGFYEAIYNLSAEAPHQVIDIETENLVPYDVMIMF